MALTNHIPCSSSDRDAEREAARVYSIGRRYIIDFHPDEVVAPELAVDCEIEQGQVTLTALELELDAYGPDSPSASIDVSGRPEDRELLLSGLRLAMRDAA